MSAPGTMAWFAHHEFRLAWREWLAMMTAGRRSRLRTVVIAFLILAIFMHGVAFAMVSGFGGIAVHPDKTALVVLTGSVLLSWLLMLSQAMESVTRAFYTRSDLDLLMSSPAAAHKLFSVRICTMALAVMAMAALLASPFIDVLALTGGVRWLAAYAAVIAMGAAATAVAAVLATLLFVTVGAKRTRLIAQILAAVVGAGFVIGLQMAAIMSYGTLSRLALMASEPFVAIAPGVDSIVWWPARAILGEAGALVAMIAASLLALGISIAIVAPRFADCAMAASGAVFASASSAGRTVHFRALSPRQILRRKEWMLLRRDPWLVSQTLMQLLYLVPPAFLLWRSFGTGSGSEVLLVPVLVMAAGQLGGGLAWLAVSGEDAPDLVATAPLASGDITRAKIEAVMGAIMMVFAPFLVALALASPYEAVVSAVGIAVAAVAATHVQLCFRAQAKRSHFRRRQTSSRVATIAEAFVSIAWAGTAGLAANGLGIAVVPAVIALAISTSVHVLGPRNSQA